MGIPYYVRIIKKLWGKCFRSLIYFILFGKKRLCAYQSREKGSGYIRGEQIADKSLRKLTNSPKIAGIRPGT